MKLIKQASGKTTIKLSRREWENFGKKAGWIGSSENNQSGWLTTAGYDEWLAEGYDDSGPSCPECGEDMMRGESWRDPDWVCPSCKENLDEDFDDSDDSGSYEVDAKEWGGMELPDSPY